MDRNGPISSIERIKRGGAYRAMAFELKCATGGNLMDMKTVKGKYYR